MRRATALVRDVEGVHVVTADAKSGLMTLRGTMSDTDIVVSLRKSTFTPRLIAEEPRPQA